MTDKVACIIIDSGYSAAVLSRCRKVVGFADLTTNTWLVGEPYLTQNQLHAVAGDTLNHGTLVLEALLKQEPDVPLVLVRAYGRENKLIRTTWSGYDREHRGGQVQRPGWTEAYRWAVELCRERNLRSVANCSFGGYTHAVDGTGWEAHRLAEVAGPGRAGHIVVAAAGPGDGRAAHASWQQGPDSRVTVVAFQRQHTQYNFWDSGVDCEWFLEVWQEHRRLEAISSAQIQPNIWTPRRQVNLLVPATGEVQFRIFTGTKGGDFHCWVTDTESAAFSNYVDARLIAEPAVFPHVLAVGLKSGIYAPNQGQPGSKPEILLDGAGPISFRAPEVTVAVARILRETNADIEDMKRLFHATS